MLMNIVVYAMTEAGLIAVAPFDKVKPGSVGTVVPIVECKVRMY